jgi:hypothetical protein
VTSPSPARTSWWLYGVLALAAVAIALGALDLAFAAYAGVTGSSGRALDLAFPAALFLVGVLACVVAMPRVSLRGRSFSPPRAVNWLALLLGAAGTLLGGAGLVVGIADGGIAALMDFPVPLFVLLALWCMLGGGGNLLRRNTSSESPVANAGRDG